MIKNYVRLAWRNLVKHRSSAVINIGGLALGLTTSILVVLFLVDQFSFDRFHRNIGSLYLLMKHQQVADGVSTGGASAGPMAGALLQALPEVQNSAREVRVGTVARVGDKQVTLDGIYTDTGFFSMMSFPAVEGDPGQALRDRGAVILTESTAKKLFGNRPALGATFLEDTVPVRVAAIVRDVPSSSTIQFDFVRPIAVFESGNAWLKKWDDNRINTWLQLKPGADPAVVDRKATGILQARSNDTSVTTFVWPMASVRLHSHFNNNGKPSGGKIYMVELVALLGFLVLLIACINFMNMATARSEVRAREVGVRKVMGATRRQLMAQFFCEALTITFCSMVMGILISLEVLPVFNRLMETNLQFDAFDWRIWAAIMGTALLTGLMAGSYPAVFLSRFAPARVLKGEMMMGRKRTFFRRALVTTQFWITILFILSTIVVWQEIQYVKGRPIGYDQENLIDVHASADLGAKYQLFNDQVSRLPGVKSISVSSENLVNYPGAVTGMDWPGKIPGHEIPILISTVGYHWTKTAGISVVEGRDFDPSFGTDTSGCLVNESAVSRLGLKEPVIGQKLSGSPIIGVVRNFVTNNPSGDIAPLAIYLYRGAPGPGHFFVRINNSDHWRETIAAVAAVTRTLDPRHGFDFRFSKEEYQLRFEEFHHNATLATIFGALAILISCLGLLGLSAFLSERRAKEMSIRKVFGASAARVLVLLSADFLRPVIVAFVLAIPVAIWVLRAFLGGIAYHISLGWTVFAMAGLLTLVIALATVGWQAVRTAGENPARKLRSE